MKLPTLVAALALALIVTAAQAHKPRFSDGTAVDPQHAHPAFQVDGFPRGAEARVH